MVIDGRKVLVACQTDRIELATNRLNEVTLPFIIDHFVGTPTVPILIISGEDAVFPMHDRGHFVSILVEVAHALLSNNGFGLG